MCWLWDMDSILLMPERLEFLFVKENLIVSCGLESHFSSGITQLQKKNQKKKNRKNPYPFPWGEARQGEDGELQQRDAK